MKKSILITGATKGISQAISLYLNQIGYHVIGIARTCPTWDFPGSLYLADLSSEVETQAIFDEIKNQYCVSGLINNIGVANPISLENLKLADFHYVLDINLRPAVQAVQTFMSQMKANKWGRIINISSRAILGKPGRSSYSAAKAALIGLTRTWALELVKDGITVNAIAPGPINTEQFFLNHPKGSNEEKAVMASIPMKRMGEADEIAFAASFFLDVKAGFITGQTLFVDGGGSLGAMMF